MLYFHFPNEPVNPWTHEPILLYYRQGDAVDLLVDVEGVDIGHAADIVDDGHEARFEVGGVDVVLARHTADEVLGVEALGMDGGPDEFLHEGLDNLVTWELYVEHGTTLVDMIDREAATVLIGGLLDGADMIDQAALEFAAQNGFLVVCEHAHAFIF